MPQRGTVLMFLFRIAGSVVGDEKEWACRYQKKTKEHTDVPVWYTTVQ